MSGRLFRAAGLAALLAAAVGATVATAAAPASVQAGASAPDFTVRTVEGTPFRLSAQRGNVVVLDFLTTSCGECNIEAPALERAAQRFRGSGLRILILDVDCCTPRRQLAAFYHRKLGLEHVLVAADRGLRVARRYGFTRLGTTVIVGRDGARTWQGTWFGQEQELFRRIERALS